MNFDAEAFGCAILLCKAVYRENFRPKEIIERKIYIVELMCSQIFAVQCCQRQIFYYNRPNGGRMGWACLGGGGGWRKGVSW